MESRGADSEPESQPGDPENGGENLDDELTPVEPDSSEYSVFDDAPLISGGCIVSERPTFLRNSVLCVVNHRKCVLYNSQNGRKLAETHYNPAQIIGCKSFIYDNEHEILLCASADGVILAHLVPEDLCAADRDGSDAALRYQQGPNRLNALFGCKVACKNLLKIETNRHGALLCVMLTHDLHVDVVCFKPNYKQIMVKPGNGLVQLTKHSTTHEFARVATVLSKVEVFETDAEMDRLALAANKSCLLVNRKTREAAYFEAENAISCMAFDAAGRLTVGDVIGRIMIYTLDAVDARGTAEASTYLGFKLGESVSLEELAGVYSNAASARGPPPPRRPLATKVLHWHAHSVTSICYSRHLLISGGEEGVVVVWDLPDNSKKFVTRLGGPIFFLGVSAERVIYAAVQTNAIFTINPTTLAVTAKIASLYVGNALNRTDPESNIIRYREPNEFGAMAEAHAGDGAHTARNKIVNVASDKLQIFDYVNNVETKLINISDTNYVSRQDNETRERNYSVTHCCISSDCKYVLVVQTRPTFASGTDAPDEDDRKYVLRFYALNRAKDNYTLHSIIQNPHEGRITALKQLNAANRFVSTATDGKLNVYAPARCTTAAGTLGGEQWVCRLVAEYKGLPILRISLSPYSTLILLHERVLSLWKHARQGEADELRLVRGAPLPLEVGRAHAQKPVIYIKFAGRELVIAATRAEIYLYNTKLNRTRQIHALEPAADCERREIHDIKFKYGLLALNVRNYLNVRRAHPQAADYTNAVEIFSLDRKGRFTRLHAMTKPELNDQLKMQLLPAPIRIVRRGARGARELTSPVFGGADEHYNLLVVNAEQLIEVVAIRRAGSGFKLHEFRRDEVRFTRLVRTSPDLRAQLGELVEYMLVKSELCRRKRRRGPLICQYHRKHSVRWRAKNTEEFLDRLFALRELPTPNALIDQMYKRAI